MNDNSEGPIAKVMTLKSVKIQYEKDIERDYFICHIIQVLQQILQINNMYTNTCSVLSLVTLFNVSLSEEFDTVMKADGWMGNP